MKYKALLLDIDNTLYNYNTPHACAKKSVVSYCATKFNIKESVISSSYNQARIKVHQDLHETAASHNRLLYFQNMCERLAINPTKNSLKLYDIYWNNFLENMVPFKGVYELLKKYQNKICLVTDLTAHIQFRKIEKLKLNEYCQALVTSEEAGKEKPNPIMFRLALQKLNLKPSEVCMIGDNFEKDVLGANSLNIDTIWFNHEENQDSYSDSTIKEARTFKKILDFV
jgi:HAD superfamily hydrolase (TIGR01549 family)